MLNPEIACGLFFSKTWKSSFFKLPTARPCASRTTTGTSTAFTFTWILALLFCAGASFDCWGAACAQKAQISQHWAMAATRFMLLFPFLSNTTSDLQVGHA